MRIKLSERKVKEKLEKNKKEENNLEEKKENIQLRKLPYAGTNEILLDLILLALIVTARDIINSKKRLNTIKRVTNIINGSIRRKNK